MGAVDLICVLYFFMDVFKDQDMHDKDGNGVTSARVEHNMEESCFCPLAQGLHDTHSNGMNADVSQDGGLLEVTRDRTLKTTLHSAKAEARFAFAQQLWILSVRMFILRSRGKRRDYSYGGALAFQGKLAKTRMVCTSRASWGMGPSTKQTRMQVCGCSGMQCNEIRCLRCRAKRRTAWATHRARQAYECAYGVGNS